MPTIRSKPLTIVHEMPVSKTTRFWEGLKEGKIYTTKCSGCGELFFPPAADCPKCLSSKMEWIELSGEGQVEAFTHVIVKPTSFQQEPPYTVAIGRLEEGVKVLARLTGAKMTQVKVGMNVRLVVSTTHEGEPTYVFTPK